jgi:adenine-specific DNA-methyltransferase
MPTLNWIGKESVVNHDKEVPFRLLKKIKSFSVGDNSENLIIHGDNLEALKALMPYYQGKIKCIYIDPPYNTGNESWVYNDKVNSPKIKKWLGKVVGGESEDLCRHDKWLCMMYPRLKLLRDLLSEDGVIFVSIDDNEHCNLRQVFDEIFEENNFITTFIWKKRSGGGYTNTLVSANHDYIMVFAKDINKVKFNDKIKSEEDIISRYPLKDKRGYYKRRDLRKSGSADLRSDRPTMYYSVIAPDSSKIFPKRQDGKEGRWAVSEKTFLELLNKGEVEFVKQKEGYKVYTKERPINEEGELKSEKYETIWTNVALNTNARNEIKELFPEMDKTFETPKPVDLIKQIVKLNSDSDSIILDSFAGSGTTAHAVLELNKEDGGNRKFIHIEMEDKVAKDITAERVKRAIKKYDYKDGFEYCELDKPLFNEEGQIEEECSFEQLATYIYFTETNTNLDKKIIDKHFIGEHNEIEYYLLFKEKGKNILNKDFLKKLGKDKKKKIIYADKCLIDDKILERHNIQFKQIPYEVKVY